MTSVSTASRRDDLDMAGWIWVPVLLVGLALAGVGASLLVGPATISQRDIREVLVDRLLPWIDSAGPSPTIDQIIWDIRLPRALLGLVVGASLAVAGTVLQALVRNPLADPFVLGVSSGASLAAVAVLIFGSASLGGASLTAAAFVGALVSLAVVALLARGPAGYTPTRLVLSGVALSYALSGLTSWLIFHGDNDRAAASVLFWLLGSLGAAAWPDLGAPTVILVVCVALLIRRASQLDALVMGDETATTLGLDLRRFRRTLLIVTSLITGAAVSVSGGIGFVGLMMPHLARLVLGASHRKVLLTSAAAGAAFLVWVDLCARTVAQPSELPLGIITSVVGGPAFIVLMRRRHHEDDAS